MGWIGGECGGGGVLFLDEFGSFDEAAEFFFGDVVDGALGGVRGVGLFVADGEAFPDDDAEVEVALFPELVLGEFEHGVGGVVER